QEDGLDVHFHHSVPVRLAQIEHRCAADDAGIVEQNVNSVAFLGHGSHHALAIGRAGHIGGQEESLASVLHDLFGDLFARLFVHVYSGHFGGFPGEQYRAGTSNAGRRAGNERYLALQPTRSGLASHMSVPSFHKVRRLSISPSFVASAPCPSSTGPLQVLEPTLPRYSFYRRTECTLGGKRSVSAYESSGLASCPGTGDVRVECQRRTEQARQCIPGSR